METVLTKAGAALSHALDACVTVLEASLASSAAPLLRVFLQVEKLPAPGDDLVLCVDGDSHERVTEKCFVVYGRSVAAALEAHARAAGGGAVLNRLMHPVKGFRALTEADGFGTAPLPPLLLSPEASAVVLLLAPGSDYLWGARKASLASAARRRLLKELVLCDAVLSFYHKTGEAWVHRGWCLQRLGDREPAAALALLQSGDGAFFYAAAAHPLNYNAWAYRRRCVLALPATVRAAAWVAEGERVASFIKVHNSDASAASYLLFVLDRSGDEGLWRALMRLTQAGLRTHADKGHECLWMLRLGLVEWAVGRGKGSGCGSAWTVADELDWVSAQVWAASPRLLAPVSRAASEAAVECNGSLGWNSYYACRYGLQLLALVSRALPC